MYFANNLKFARGDNYGDTNVVYLFYSSGQKLT